MKREEFIIPKQKVGEQTGARSEVKKVSVREAKALFEEALQRLTDINNWKKYSGVLSSDFLLTDAEGNPVDRVPKAGDLIRIDLPGPGTKEGEGYDWVRVEAIDEEHTEHIDLFAFRVRPCAHPDSRDRDVAHFYQRLATSSFILKREGNIVIAAEEGRNEVPNTELEKFTDNIRNKLVAESARHGFSFPQWKTLVNGILGK